MELSKRKLYHNESSAMEGLESIVASINTLKYTTFHTIFTAHANYLVIWGFWKISNLLHTKYLYIDLIVFRPWPTILYS